jgi:hypothetical protein
VDDPPMSDTRIPPESLTARGSTRWWIAGLAVGVVAIALLIVASDGRKLVEVAGAIDSSSLVLPLLCTAASYAAMARSYQRIAQAAGVTVGFLDILRITLVSTAANYVVSTGGLSGLAVRSYYFSEQHRLPWGGAVSISLAQTFITNLVLCAFLFWGVLNLLFYDDVEGRSLAAVAALFVLALVLCFGAVAIVASRSIRRRLFAGIVRAADFFSRAFVRRRAAVRASLALFEEELHEGTDFLISRGRDMLEPLVWVFLDWFLMLATLYAAFLCVGQNVAMHVVVIGFSTGVFLSTVNLVPGGLGIMEGSMAAVFASLGVPLEPAVVATLIFRVTYYVVPLVVSLVLFRDFTRGLRRARAVGSPSPNRSTA